MRAAGGGAARSPATRASAPRSRSRSPRRTRRCSGGWTRSTSSSGRSPSSATPTPALAARLEGELVVCGLHDARRAARVAPVLERLASRRRRGAPAEALAVARGMAMVLAGRPAERGRRPAGGGAGAGGADAPRTGTRARRCCGASSRPSASTPSRRRSRRCSPRSTARAARAASWPPTARSACSSCGSGALPEADAAARVALRVLQEGDFAPGLAFAATVLADVAVEAGELDEAEALLGPAAPGRAGRAGVGTVLIPAARGRLRLAQGRAAEALADFETCAAMFDPDAVGHGDARRRLPARALGRRARAAAARASASARCELAEAELADVRAFGAPRALGVALRVAGLVARRRARARVARRSVAALRSSPALLERARSLAELGAALRRAGRRAAAREPLAEALDLAARCGARPLAARAREELRATGARPRRAWRTRRGGADARASCASCAWRPRAAPTARSPTSST